MTKEMDAIKQALLDKMNKRLDADQQLLLNIKAKLPELETLLEKTLSHWKYEDLIYRFYHQSYKVYQLQYCTEEIIAALKELAPDKELNLRFTQILSEGTGKEFVLEHNRRWLQETRPILEAFFHAKYFLEMAVKYGKELEEAPGLLPSGWAGFLYLYNMR